MEMTRFPSYRGFSVRSILGFALAVIITALLWAILASPAAHAATTATWNGNNILFDNHAYGKAGKEINQKLGLADDIAVYSYIPQTNGSANAKATEAHFIYFASGVDPPKATTADYVLYDLDNGIYSNARAKQSIEITPNGKEDSVASSCSVSGIGWIVCPVSVFLADSMDFLFEQIQGFLEVKPLSLNFNASNGMYTAWNVMRSLANVAFIIAFLIIIYSQLTGMGVGSYGIKKLLPRLIIAAVLVNISFLVCAVAIDASNIIGNGLHDILQAIRRDTFNITDDTAGLNAGNGWSNLTAIILGGGGAIWGVGYAVSSGAVTALVPMLVLLALTLFVVFVILAARQAIIFLLVIIAPLAFVANLLPNTEGLFNKWRKLLTTMLVFYPAFALIFSGAQLAGQLIIQNSNGNILNVLFGMAVQIAPLAITPIIFKLSGSLLSRIGALVNNPNKGPVDRTRKWADRKAGLINSNTRKRGATSRNFLNPANLVRSLSDNAKNDADSTKANDQDSENRRMTHSRRYGHIYSNQAHADLVRDRVHNDHAEHVERQKSQQGSRFYNSAANAVVSKENLESAQNATTAFHNAQRTIGGTALNQSMMQLEASKLGLDISDNNKNRYISDEKQRVGSTLHGLVDTYESSKLKLEGSQSRYTAMVDSMKLDASKELHLASINAQSGKDQVEFAQQKLQAMFDTQRTTEGTTLNVDFKNLETSKGLAEGARAQVAEYIATQKSTVGTNIHDVFMQTEKLKQQQQIAETQLSRVIEEYKAGGKRIVDDAGVERVFINNEDVTGTQRQTLADAMIRNSEQLSAETQGVQSAKNEQQQRISSVLAEEGSARAEELLNIAGSIDDNGKQRALATALAQRSRSRKETLDNIEAIIGFRNYTDEQVRQLAEGTPLPGIDHTADAIAAAMKMTLSGGNTKEILTALKNIDFSFPGYSDAEREELQVIASDALMSSGVRPPFMTVGFTKMMKSGVAYDGNDFAGSLGEDGVNDMILRSIQAGKIDSKKLQTAGKDYAEAILGAVQSNPGALTQAQRDSLLASLTQTLDPKREASEGLADSRPYLIEMFEMYGGRFDASGNPIPPNHGNANP